MVRHILVIEDSPLVARVVEMCLRPLALPIRVAGDGRSGLQMALSGVPDLIVLDIGLPGMSGWEVLDHLRQDPVTVDIPVLTLTAHAAEESSLPAHDPDAFMTKPFEPDRLRSTARTLITSGRTRRSVEVV